MSAEVLQKYLGRFGSVSRNVNRAGEGAPHKPLLLLALLDEVQKGTYTRNEIPVTPELVASFRAYWRALVPEGSGWRQDRIVYPFRYLRGDGFWELTRGGRVLASGELGEYTSLVKMAEAVDAGRFAADLWELLHNTIAVNALRTHVLTTYFPPSATASVAQIPTDRLDYEAQKLKAEANSPYRVKKARETSGDEGYYVRHRLFPRVVKSLYRDACCVCGLGVTHPPNGGIVDAAHIVPFALSHNDDPRNGLALSKTTTGASMPDGSAFPSRTQFSCRPACKTVYRT